MRNQRHIPVPRSGVIVHCDGKILIILGTDSTIIENYGGKTIKLPPTWGFVKGVCGMGETPAECAIRKLKDEIGVEAVEGNLEQTNIIVNNYQFFLLKVDSLDITPNMSKIGGARWIESIDSLVEQMNLAYGHEDHIHLNKSCFKAVLQIMGSCGFGMALVQRTGN